MSIALLANVSKVHTIHDDLQSVFWVLLFGALLHFAHNSLSFNMNLFDQAFFPHDNSLMVKGGDMKEAFLRSQQKISGLTFMSKPLTAIYRRLAFKYNAPISSSGNAEDRCDENGDVIIESVDPDANMPAPQVVLDLFETVLTRTDWPAINDTMANQFIPRTKAQINRNSNASASRGSASGSVARSSTSVITSATTRSSGSSNQFVLPSHTLETTPTSASTGAADHNQPWNRNVKARNFVTPPFTPPVFNREPSPPFPGGPPGAKRGRRNGQRGPPPEEAGPSGQGRAPRLPSLQKSRKRASVSALLDDETPRKRRRHHDDDE